MRKYICPVCGYPGLDEPAWDNKYGTPSYNICPCCGCEFGYEDATPKAKDSYLRIWIHNGAPWRKPELKSQEWNLKNQLAHIGINLDKLIE